MNREIKFRGKSSMEQHALSAIGFDKSEWIIGNLIQNGDTPYIVGRIAEVTDEYMAHEFWVPVYPETVGQYTGLKDINGNSICEGDLLKTEDGVITKIVYDEASFKCVFRHNGQLKHSILDNLFVSSMLNPEIIGNIHENPELLEQPNAN